MASVQDVVGAAGRSVGRHFSVVGTIPSLILVLYVFVLVSSGAWSGVPHPVRAWDSLTHLSVGETAALSVLTLASAVILHPLQFALIQFFEGYWGTSPVARRAWAARVRHHRRRYDRLAADATDPGGGVESQRLLGKYPDDPGEIMPTRLGNVLRRHERLAGRPYGLDAVVVVPLLLAVAPADQADYIADRRTQLDLAVRAALTALLAAVITVFFMWRHGIWLLLALVPYLATYVAYRGAVVAAESYGAALSDLTVLNRFELYRRLHLSLPDDIAAELTQNADLMWHLNHRPRRMKYDNTGVTGES